MKRAPQGAPVIVAMAAFSAGRWRQLGKIAVFAGLGRLMRHAGQGVAQQGQRFLGQDMKAAGLQVRTAWRPSRR